MKNYVIVPKILVNVRKIQLKLFNIIFWLVGTFSSSTCSFRIELSFLS